MPKALLGMKWQVSTVQRPANLILCSGRKDSFTFQMTVMTFMKSCTTSHKYTISVWFGVTTVGENIRSVVLSRSTDRGRLC